MRSYEFQSTIVDRNNESDEIQRDLANTPHNKIRFICAESAIGKSALSKKILEKYNEDTRQVISVKTRPENATTNASDWLYIDRMFECFNQHFDSSPNCKRYCFDNYIKNTKDKFLKKKIYECILERSFACKTKTGLFFVFFYYQITKLLKIKEFNSQNIVNSNSFESHLIKARYIQYIFSNVDLFLVIDNIQNIDSTSMKYFIDWLSMCKNRKHYIILEYTISSQYTFDNALQMIEQFSGSGTQVVYSILEKLAPEYVIDVIENHFPEKPQDLDFNIDLLKHYKTEANGNLRQLIDYTIGYTPDKKEVHSPTLDNLLALTTPSKYIFSILVNCNGEIPLEWLKNLLLQMHILSDEFNRSLNELISNEMINVDDQKAIITHASLSDTWKGTTEFDEFNSLSYAKMETYFGHILRTSANEDSRNYAWVILLQLYAINDPYKINTLLSEINEKIINQISPANAWKYLSLFVDVTKERINEFTDIYFQILQTCFEMEWYDKGYYCLSLLEESINIEQNNKLLLYKSMYFSALDMHQKNVELYEKFLPTLEADSRAYFNLNMIVLCSFRSLNNYDRCLQIHRILYKKRKLMDKYDYAMFMRLTNVYLPDNKALLCAKKSIYTFHKLGNFAQESKSMITYAKLLSGLGHNPQAIKCILKAEQLLKNRYMGRHMIYNNQAAFLLMQGKTDDSILHLLNQAECSAIVPYDRLAIIVNKLVWCYQNSNYNILDLLISKATELIPQEPDAHVHVLIYYNLYLVYSQMNYDSKAAEYYKLAFDNRDKCKFVKARFDNIKVPEMKYRLKFPWHVCYLSFWTYDLDSTLSDAEYTHSS